MKINTLKGLMIIPEIGYVKYVEVENNFDKLKHSLGFDLADIVDRRIGDKYFDVICDDEALLKETIIPSAIESNTRNIMLCGSLFLCHHDKQGNLTSAKEEEFYDIKLVRASQDTPLGRRRFTMIELDY